MGKVIISVQSGLVELEELPTDVEVEVKDYDVSAYDDDDERIELDEDGRRFIHRVLQTNA